MSCYLKIGKIRDFEILTLGLNINSMISASQIFKPRVKILQSLVLDSVLHFDVLR